MKKRQADKKLRRNPAALFAAIIIAASGFLFPLFAFSIFGETFSDKSGVIINLIIDLFNGKLTFSKGYEIAIIGMVLLYIVILLLYLLNGLGAIYNRYSRYASILSIVYLFLGLLAVVLINRETSSYLFGNLLGGITIGLGTYLVTIVGVAYLFLKKAINSRISF